MVLSLGSEKFGQYRDLAEVFWRHGLIDAHSGFWLEDVLKGHFSSNGNGDGRASSEALATFLTDLKQNASTCGADMELQQRGVKLVEDLTRLGPTYIRIGQILAKRPDLLPSEYIRALEDRIFLDVEPMPYEQMVKAIEADLHMSVHDIFSNIEMTPMVATPFDQSHKGFLKGGTPIIIKVQRPGVAEQVAADLTLLQEFAEFCDKHPTLATPFKLVEVLSEVRRILTAELDFVHEARSLKIVSQKLSEYERLIVPIPVPSFSSSKVLTTEMEEGLSIDSNSIVGLLLSERQEIANQVFHAYLKLILVSGFVDGDPDTGSLLLTRKGQIVLMDAGRMTNISAELQQKILQLLIAVNERRSEQAAAVLISLGHADPRFDREFFQKEITELIAIHRDVENTQLEFGMFLLGLGELTYKHGLALPSEFALVSASLVTLDRILNVLEPNFDSRAFLEDHVPEMMRRHVVRTFNLNNFFQQFMESAHLLERLPSRVGKILDSVADNSFKVTVNAIDEEVLISGFQKIANRITVGIILASLIIGAAMLMRVPTEFMIFGYPGLAMLCFLFAGGLGGILVIEIMFSDLFKREVDNREQS